MKAQSSTMRAWWRSCKDIFTNHHINNYQLIMRLFVEQPLASPGSANKYTLKSFKVTA